MKYTLYKYIALAALIIGGMSSCDDFLDKPTKDAYNADNYYQTDDQCIAGVNYLYNSPWYDFQRGFFKVGEGLSGNLYMGNSPYLKFTVNGSDEGANASPGRPWHTSTSCAASAKYLSCTTMPSRSMPVTTTPIPR